ncbi:unnamed protein product, partial [Polarella glacialis]
NANSAAALAALRAAKGASPASPCSSLGTPREFVSAAPLSGRGRTAAGFVRSGLYPSELSGRSARGFPDNTQAPTREPGFVASREVAAAFASARARYCELQAAAEHVGNARSVRS